MNINNNVVWGMVITFIILALVIMYFNAENKKLKRKVEIMMKKCGITEPKKEELNDEESEEIKLFGKKIENPSNNYL